MGSRRRRNLVGINTLGENSYDRLMYVAACRSCKVESNLKAANIIRTVLYIKFLKNRVADYYSWLKA